MSIKQKAELLSQGSELPDFRNLGVLLRILLVVNVLALGTVLIIEAEPANWLPRWFDMAAHLELPLLCCVLLLYLAHPLLQRQPLWRAWALVLTGVAGVVAGMFPLLAGQVDPMVWRWVVWSLAATVVCLSYFEFRNRRLSSSLAEARMKALTARIRPHFLFNALNGVLGIIRSDPRRAERALEELADLFRALMKEQQELVPLSHELSLCERYLDLEALRLGDRLQVHWLLDGCPRDALVPPLMLQPLLENAVYHGIEPATRPGVIQVRGRRKGKMLILRVENPLLPQAGVRHAGNKLALANIRERLMLFFDLEARLETDIRAGQYRVTIWIPYRRAGVAKP